MTKIKFKKSLSAAALSLLSACGGGGGSAGVNTAEGLWQGTSSTSAGASVQIVVLENGEAWGGAAVGNTLVSALAGNANGNGTSFSASGSEFNFTTNTFASGTYSGTVTQKSRIQATSTLGNTINLTYNPYYEQSISSADIAGTYLLSGRTAGYSITNLSLTIGPAGNFTVVDGGCTTTGTVTPRAAGKVVANVSFTGVGTCILGNGVTVNGIAVLDKVASPKTLSLIALNAGKTDGMVLIGTKIN